MTKKQKEAYQKYMATGLYFVTCIRPKVFRYRVKNGPEKGKMKQGLSYRGKYPTTHRCWGWYRRLKDAVKAIEGNHTDLHEGDNQYALIEKVPHGVVPMSEKVQWYIWVGDPDKGAYVECDEPEWSRSICNWSIG